MDKKQVGNIIKRLDCLYLKTGFEEPQKKIEYANAFISFDYDLMNKVIDLIVTDGIENDNGDVNKTFLPTPAEIITVYRKVERINRDNKAFETESGCYVCENKGFIVHRKNGYEYVLYCTECEKGNDYKYDGRNNKEHKTDYYSEPVTKYYDFEELKSQNMFKSHEVKPMPDYVRAKLHQCIRRMSV